MSAVWEWGENVPWLVLEGDGERDALLENLRAVRNDGELRDKGRTKRPCSRTIQSVDNARHNSLPRNISSLA